MNSPRVPLQLIFIATLAACGGGKEQQAAAPAAAPAAPAATSVGEQQFATCAVCHQTTGLGIAATFPPLAGSEIVNGKADAHIRIVLQGVTGPFTVKGAQYNGVMPTLGGTMNDDQVAAVINYERSSWGNTGAQVTAAQVAAVRAATTSRTTPWTEAELKAFR
jgi:mono/diheme cytochrome c family protein